MRLTAFLLILIPILWISLRIASNSQFDQGILSEIQHNVTYDFRISGQEDTLRAEIYLPPETVRQEIYLDSLQLSSSVFNLTSPNGSKILLLKGFFSSDTTLSISYTAKTRPIQYVINDSLTNEENNYQENQEYLESTSLIQSNHPDIALRAYELRQNSNSAIKDLANKLFKYVVEIPSSEQPGLMDAQTCLENQLCSGNGKSRLLAALFRANQIPSRIASGVILEEGSKKTSHITWTEAYIGGVWIPFDTLNGYFAELPENYLKIFAGENFLITHNEGYDIDFIYHISKERINHYPDLAIFNIWNLIDSKIVPLEPLLVLLLLPLGAYLVAVFKNVVGLDTYGVFLPVLIAFALMDMGIIQGLVFFTMIVGLIGLLSVPLTKWEILHTPKIVILLTAVAIFSLISIKTFYQTGWVNPSATLTFPMIILTIISENFARKIEEESLKEAMLIYAQTIIVTLTCTWILSSDLLQNFFITFPEALFIVAGMSLLLGKWIGLRLIEYKRFASIDEEVKHV